MSKTTLEILSERREPTVLLDPSGKITTLERLARGTYREIDTFENAIMYAQAVPPDASEEYLRQINAGALLDYTDYYYETKYYENLLAIIGHVGLELTLRHTVNGARFSSVQSAQGALHVNEHFLAVSPSIYYSVGDARDTLVNRYRDTLADNSW